MLVARLVHFLLLLALAAMPVGMAAAVPTDHREEAASGHCDPATPDRGDTDRQGEMRLHCVVACTFLPPPAAPLVSALPQLAPSPVAATATGHKAFNPAAEPPPPRRS